MRQDACDRIIDECAFIARASEGAISIDWIMNQTINTRDRYVKKLNQELKEREQRMNTPKKK